MSDGAFFAAVAAAWATALVVALVVGGWAAGLAVVAVTAIRLLFGMRKRES